MPTRVRIYISGVIGAGALLLGAALLQWSSPSSMRFLVFLGLATLGSMLKFRLPRITGAYSLSFFFILIGIFHFTLAETILAGCVSAFASSFWGAKSRPTLVQVLFNTANLCLSIGAAYASSHSSLAPLQGFRPAALAVAATVLFVVNTVLVSGVLSLLEGKRFREVCQEWYLWSFPYYLVGSALIGMLPLGGAAATPEGWLLLLPPLYLVHFYYGLGEEHRPKDASGSAQNGGVAMGRGMIYFSLVITAGVMLLAWAGLRWESAETRRFAGFLAAAILGATFKIRLPGFTGTLSPSFVVLLASIVQLSLSEVILISGITSVLQLVWKARRRPTLLQVLFNPTSLILSAGLAHTVCTWLAASGVATSVSALLVPATLLLFGANTSLVSGAIRLAEGGRLREIWQRCCFWSLPFYLVGAAVSGLVIAASEQIGWQPSFLVLPLMVLVYISYRVQLTRSVPATAAVTPA